MKDYEQIISRLLAKIAELEEIVKQQAARIGELERRLNKNSSNSSKPPSSDELKKPPRTNSLREKGKHKSGGQPGHKGETLKQVDTPDIIKKYKMTSCPDCQKSLVLSPVIKVVKRQVFDIPVPQIQVTEHQAAVKYYNCCNKIVTALFPDKITAQVQYGEIIRSWCVYYQYQHFIPEDRLQQLFKDMYGVSLATASISNYNNTAYQALARFEENILSMAKTAQVKHLDETGFRVGGKSQWLHTLSTNTLTYYHVSPKRKSLIDGLKGIVVHDHWRPYYQLPNVKHVLCNQHHAICQKLMKLPGVGPMTASIIHATIGDPGHFKNGRHFAAFLGVVPKEHSSGGKQCLMSISKRGSRYIRSLLVHGGRSVVKNAGKKDNYLGHWVQRVHKERGYNKAAVAVANKNARHMWAIMSYGDKYIDHLKLCA